MLRDKLNGAMKLAMKEKDKRRLATIRLILAAIKDRDISQRGEQGAAGVSEDDILEILSKMVKQRQESIKAYEEGGRLELAEQEREEVQIIREFLPRQMDDAEIDAAVAAAIEATKASGLKDIGKIMALLKDKYTGQMDFAKASAAAKAALS